MELGSIMLLAQPECHVNLQEKKEKEERKKKKKTKQIGLVMWSRYIYAKKSKTERNERVRPSLCRPQ